MRLRRLLPLFAAVLAACGDSGPSVPAAQPGELTVHLTTPGGSEGAVILQLTTASATVGEVTTRVPGALVFARSTDGGTRVLVVGTIPPGELLRFRVPDVNLPGAYGVSLVEVADTENRLRDELGGYTVQVRP
jgi:hypothetical protein